MKDWFLKAEFEPEFSVTLTRPIYMAKDNYKLKRETKRALIEIRETYSGTLVLPYSGGFDSSFVLLCYMDNIREGRLKKTDFIVREAIFIAEECKDENIPTHTEASRFLRDYMIDGVDYRYDKIILNKELLQEITKELKEVSTLNEFLGQLLDLWRKKTLGEHSFIWCEGFPKPNKRQIGIGPQPRRAVWDSLLCLSNNGFKYLKSNDNINIFHWDEHVFSSFLTNFWYHQPIIAFNKGVHLNEYFWFNAQEGLSRQMIMMQCYPELFSCYPKRKMINEDHRGRLWNQIVARLNSYEVRTPLQLPNGEKVTSVEQTQEFFNRHS